MDADAKLKLLCVSGSCSNRLELPKVAKLFSFVKKDRRFGGRLCVAFSGATLWIYASGKLTVLGREVSQVETAYAITRRRLEESGHASNIGDPTAWNIVRQIETDPGERLSLRKVCSRIPGSRFERAQRAVLCRLDNGINEIPGHSLVQIYSSGKLLIRGRNECSLPQPIWDAIPSPKSPL